MQQWTFCTSPNAPKCSENTETKLHIIRCKVHEVQCLWTTSLTDLTKWLKTQNTDPSISQQLVIALEHWHTETPCPTKGNPVLEAQSQIGQDAFMDSWLSQQRRFMQEAFWVQIQSRKSSKQWLTEILKNCGIPLGTCGNTAMAQYIQGKIISKIFWKQTSTNLFGCYICKEGQYYLKQHYPYYDNP